MKDHLKALSWYSVLLLAGLCVLALVLHHSGRQLIGTSGLNPVILLLALLATYLALTREVPLQNVISAAAIIGFISWVLLSLGQGSINRSASTWRFVVLAVIAILNSRGIARLALMQWRQRPNYGIWLLVLTVLISALSLFFW